MTELSDTDKLHAISKATNDDGTVDVELHDFNRSESDDMVSVEFITPDGEIESEVLPWPTADTEEYKFVRIFNQTGYGIIAAEEACNNGVTVKAERDPWRLHAPHTYSKTEKASNNITSIVEGVKNIRSGNGSDWDFWEMFAVSPLIAPLSFVAFPFSDNEGVADEAVGYSMALWHTALWVLIIVAIFVIFL